MSGRNRYHSVARCSCRCHIFLQDEKKGLVACKIGGDTIDSEAGTTYRKSSLRVVPFDRVSDLSTLCTFARLPFLANSLGSTKLTQLTVIIEQCVIGDTALSVI